MENEKSEDFGVALVKPTKEPKKSGRPKMLVTPEDSAKVLDVLRQGFDVHRSKGELVKATQLNPNMVVLILKELENAGQVARSGKKKGTKYHYVGQ